jgi:nitrogen fixation/metabolism regulation signal transduction histidine kinase
MKGFIKIGGFEKRLLAFFLVVSLVPTLLIAYLGARYFVESFERVGSPVLKESARNSMEIARKLQAQLEQDAAVTSRHLADEFGQQPGLRRRGAMKPFLQAVAEKHRADFVALYALEGSAWKMVASHPPAVERADTTLGVDLISPVDDPQKVVFSDQDVVVSGVRCGADSVFVAGFLMDEGTMEMMRKTGDDLSRYSAMPLYVRSQGIFLIFVISAIVVIMVVASAIASRFIARKISYPIQELARATERIAKGDLDHRVEVTSRDEIQSLITAFNDMTEDLQEYKRNLLRAERIAAWRDVARRIAHEIKNPLTPIEIAIYRLKKRLGPDEDAGKVVSESLDSILRQVEALRSMAEEFSAFAKLPEPQLARLDVNETARSVLSLYGSAVEHIEVATDYAPELPAALADAKQITGVLSNIVKNAIEAMDGRGKLTIRTSLLGAGASGNGAMVRIEIRDSGPGIPEEIRERIFDPYFTTKPKGTGLGLALAYRMLEDHGGRIAFETGTEGTTFAVDLRTATETNDGGPQAGEEKVARHKDRAGAGAGQPTGETGPADGRAADQPERENSP